jgi:choloylglycine hydrolase
MKKCALTFPLLLIFIVLLFDPTFACSTLMKTNCQGTFVGRTADYFLPLNPRIAIYPRNYKDHDEFNYLHWISKYGTVIIEDKNFKGGGFDGINEKGVNARFLMQAGNKLPPLNSKKPKIFAGSWIRYVLGTCASVNEVLANLRDHQLVFGDLGLRRNGQKVDMPVHMAVADASGDAAIIEYNHGVMQVFHGAQYNVMTNEPSLPEQLATLEKVKKDQKDYTVEFLSGGANSVRRFIRIAFNLESMPEPKNAAQAVAYMEKAINSIAVPAFDDKKSNFSPLNDAWETRWRVVYDLKNLNMYFDDDDFGKKVYLKISKLNFWDKNVKYIYPGKNKSIYSL